MAPYRVSQYLERARYYVRAHHQGALLTFVNSQDQSSSLLRWDNRLLSS